MATLQSSDQPTLRRRLAETLKGREIKNLLVRAETIEVEPVDGWRKYETTGRIFIDIELEA